MVKKSFFDKKNLEEAVECFEKSLSIFTEVFGKNSRYVASVYINFTQVLIGLNNLESAKNYLEKSLLIVKEMNEIELLINLQNTLGTLFYRMNEPENSLNCLLNAEKICGTKFPNLLFLIRYNLALSYDLNKEPDKALKCLSDLIELIEKKYSSKANKIVIDSLFIIATLYKNQNKLDETIAFFEKCAEAHEKFYGKNGYGIDRIYMELAMAYRANKKFKEAKFNYEKLLSVYEVFKDEYNKGITLLNLGDVSLALAEPNNAIDYFSRAMAVFNNNSLFAKQNIHLHYQRALSYASIQNLDKAIEDLTSAYNLAKENYGEKNVNTVRIFETIKKIKYKKETLDKKQEFENKIKNTWLETFYEYTKPIIKGTEDIMENMNTFVTQTANNVTTSAANFVGEKTDWFDKETGEYYAGWLSAGISGFISPEIYVIKGTKYGMQYVIDSREDPGMNALLEIIGFTDKTTNKFENDIKFMAWNSDFLMQFNKLDFSCLIKPEEFYESIEIKNSNGFFSCLSFNKTSATLFKLKVNESKSDNVENNVEEKINRRLNILYGHLKKYKIGKNPCTP